mmetsp:Transcript_5307/g.11605  ORF Transcript_5307/g.11605 Transcript_5307/m.11605 type:complete len:498 (+) Transcript_5307:51-1544(+)
MLLHQRLPTMHNRKVCPAPSRKSCLVLARSTQSAVKSKTQSGKASTQSGKIATQVVRKTTRGTQGSDQPVPRKSGSQFYPFITGFPFPLGPTFTRNTVRYEVEKDSIWIFEQTQALEVFNVYTPVRMTVIKLRSGGLWVHAPVAPTEECIRLIKELDAPVEYIVLPTFAYEHKAFVGPFSRKFPKAKVYVTPFQWSFPLNLPPQFLGIFPAGELVSDDPNVPWADEIEQKLLLPPSLGVAESVRFSEVAFFHKRSKTLLVTDAVVYISDKVPEVIPKEAILETARDGWLARFIAGDRTREEVAAIAKPGPAEDTEESRRKGWKRMALLVLYFNPSNILEPDESFAAISNRLIVGPVVETLVYSKIPVSVRNWVEDITSSWAFNKVIPCHFAAPVRTSPAEFKRAFAFAYEKAAETEQEEEGEQQAGSSGQQAPAASGPLAGISGLFARLTGAAAPTAKSEKMTRPVVFPEADMRALNAINNALLSLGAVKSNADLRR